MRVNITLETMKFHANHGVTADERTIGGVYEVDISLTINTNAIVTDCIDDTVDYAEIFNIVKEEMMKPSRLIEHVAGRIMEAIKAHFPQIETLTVKLSKRNPPVAGEMSRASITLIA